MLWRAVLESLRDDLLITLSVGVGCLIAALCIEPRRHFALRAAGSFAVVFAWMTATQLWILTRSVDFLTTGLIRYSVLFVLYGLSVAFMCKAGFRQCLFAVTVAYSIQNGCERLFEILRDAGVSMSVWLDRVCLGLLMAGVLWIYYRVLVRNPRGRARLDFSDLNTSVMLFMGVGVLAVSVALDLVVRRYSENGGMGLSICHDIMSALFSFLAVVVCMSHLRESESERRAAIASQLLYSERRRYEREKQIHDAINIKCHDIRHQIAALGEAGHRAELQKIDPLITIYDTSIHTRNAALDVVLSGKALASSSQRITLTCLADGRRMGFMEDSDIYALFGNILDNAIEAAQAMDDPEKRIISLNVSTRDDLLLIECQNFCTDHLTMKDGLPETTKENKDYHGYGTRSIRMLTEKYGGDLNISAEGGVFHLSILLPIPV